jgi:hypothetical protein
VSPRRLVAVGGAVLVTVVALTWALEWVVPAPFSGYLAVVVVGLVGLELLKRQPRQQALRMFGIYLRARERGQDEPGARARLVERIARGEAGRQQAARTAQAAWAGRSEKDRVVAGVGALLRERGRALDAEALGTAYDRVRDRVLIPGWDALPREFVEAIEGRLDQAQRGDLDALAGRYQLFEQRFFRGAAGLGRAPEQAVADFARLLGSLANRVAGEHPGDAERAYRLSLALRPDLNLAHAGLALLLARTGRPADGATEARIALDVLDAYARRGPEEEPSPEDVPYRSPVRLRAVLEEVVRGAAPPPAVSPGAALAAARRERIQRILWVVSLALILFSATLWFVLRGAEWGPGAAP